MKQEIEIAGDEEAMQKPKVGEILIHPGSGNLFRLGRTFDHSGYYAYNIVCCTPRTSPKPTIKEAIVGLRPWYGTVTITQKPGVAGK